MQSVGGGTMEEVRIRPCAPNDCAQLMGLIRELAEFEGMPEQVEIGEEELRAGGFSAPPLFRCLVAEGSGGALVGFALFFLIHSARGGPSLYLEDLYVTPPLRGKGIGSRLLSKTAEAALAAGCHRAYLSVLDWNSPAREFYRARGGQEMPPRLHCFRGSTIKELAAPLPLPAAPLPLPGSLPATPRC